MTIKQRENRSIIDSLSNPAHQLDLEESKEEVVKKAKYRSSFFFNLSGESKEDKRRRELSKKKELPSSNREIDKLSTEYKNKLPKNMDRRIKEVRQFFLDEISPLILAASVGCDQAMSVIKDATEDTEVDRQTQQRFNDMLIKGMNLRMSRFIVNYLGLDPKDWQKLIQQKKRNPKQSIALFPPLNEIQPDRPVTNRDRRFESKRNKEG